MSMEGNKARNLLSRISLTVAANYMDDELRERVHAMQIEDEQAFLDAYCAMHLEKFGEEFQVA